MKRVGWVVVGALIFIVCSLIVTGLVLPRKWHVERTVAINAKTQAIHNYVADLKQWPKWADSTRQVTALSYEYAGKKSGTGAKRTWRGANNSQGALSLTNSSADTGVVFISTTNSDVPNGRGSVDYTPKVGFTEVTWHDHGELPIIIGGYLLDDMQKQLGFHFEEGLERLKALAEADELSGVQ